MIILGPESNPRVAELVYAVGSNPASFGGSNPLLGTMLMVVERNRFSAKKQPIDDWYVINLDGGTIETGRAKLDELDRMEIYGSDEDFFFQPKNLCLIILGPC